MDDNLLKYAIENGMIDLSYVQEQIEMSKRKELLEKHPYSISQGNDGKWRTYIPDKEKGRKMIKKSTREAIEKEIITYWKQESEDPTIEDVFNEWNNRRLELNKISKSTHLRNEQIFTRHYGNGFGNQKIKSTEQNEFCEFLEEQISIYNLTAKAFSNLKTVTRGFLKRAKKRKLISFNVEDLFDDLDTSDTDFKKVIKEDYQEVFNEEETKKVLEYLVNNIDDKNIAVLLMFLTGIRVGELVALRHEDFVGNTFNVRRTETRYPISKGKFEYGIKEFPKSQAGVRTVIIPDAYSWIVEKIIKLNPTSEYVFLQRNGERMTTNCIRRRMVCICEKLGLYRKSPHKVRKTYGSILLDNHVDNRLIMGQMGHTDIMCTENHYHRNRKDIEKKTKILSSIPEFQ